GGQSMLRTLELPRRLRFLPHDHYGPAPPRKRQSRAEPPVDPLPDRPGPGLAGQAAREEAPRDEVARSPPLGDDPHRPHALGEHGRVVEALVGAIPAAPALVAPVEALVRALEPVVQRV